MNTKNKATRKEPLKIKRGNVTVKIYTGTNRVGGKEYPQFTLTYYSGSQRVKKRFADLEEAKREGEIAATKLANGENEVLKLTSTDRKPRDSKIAKFRRFDGTEIRRKCLRWYQDNAAAR